VEAEAREAGRRRIFPPAPEYELGSMRARRGEAGAEEARGTEEGGRRVGGIGGRGFLPRAIANFARLFFFSRRV
jgi:hypothetical protein